MHKLLLSLLFLLTACATTGPAPTTGPATPLPLTLPSSPWQGEDMDVIQQLTSSSPGGTHRFMARIALRKHLVKVTLLAPTGQRGLDIHWHGGDKMDITRADRLPPEINARRILTELFLTYWPDAVVQSSLGGTLSVTTTTSTRQVFDGPVTVMTISGGNWDGKTVLDHVTDGYRLEIRSRRIDGS